MLTGFHDSVTYVTCPTPGTGLLQMNPTLKIRRYGRLGNNLFQLMHVLELAERLRAQVDLSELLGSPVDQILDLNRLQTEANSPWQASPRIRYHEYFHFFPDNRLYLKQGARLRAYLRFPMPAPLPENTLVLHLRTGDIFGPCQLDRLVYCPYPPAFYLRILKDHPEFEKGLLCTEEPDNPLVRGILEAAPALQASRGTLVEDVQTLLAGRSVATSKSSFVFALLYLSENLERAFIIQDYLKLYPLNLLTPPPSSPFTWVNYTAPQPLLWRNSDLQRKRLESIHPADIQPSGLRKTPLAHGFSRLLNFLYQDFYHRFLAPFQEIPHCLRPHAKRISTSGYFKPAFYRQHYPQFRQTHRSPLAHYLTVGWKQGCNPSERFDTAFYTQANPGVLRSGIPPLSHFLLHGKAEGRAPVPKQS